MILELLALAAIPTAAGISEAAHQQRIVNREADAENRKLRFYLDVYCGAKSKKRDEVHNAMVVLRDGKLYLWPKDPETNLPLALEDGTPAPHPFTGFYTPFPNAELPNSLVPSSPVLGLVSTIPPSDSQSSKPSSDEKPKLNWIYADKFTMEVKYGPRVKARDHIIGPWDWTSDEDGLGLMLEGDETLVAVEEEKGGLGWAVYFDRFDDGLKWLEIGREKRVLRCSLERRLLDGDEVAKRIRVKEYQSG
ncbi:hypothetical protein AOQ84DRAFT_372491 [Glonium stellatum]|uniref:Uncharacterized protein n=1 Tax=Glonium stellatum TaxID=574774 RepID=A0A8E2F9J2_9PEZI|nr:hypothetical protein AOQ84DRAFT_372491 [Glonium stellatum]